MSHALEVLEFFSPDLFDVFFFKSRLGKVLAYGVYHLFNYGAARQVYDLDQQLSGKPESNGKKVSAVLLPSWHNAFAIGKYAPEKTAKNAWLHSLGQVFAPSSYAAYQFSKLRKKAGLESKDGSWAVFLAPSMYTMAYAKELNESPQKLNLLSASLYLPMSQIQKKPTFTPTYQANTPLKNSLFLSFFFIVLFV